MEIKLPFLTQATGAGELVQRATAAAGIKQKEGCGCKERAKRLDRALTFVPMRQAQPLRTASVWTIPPEAPEGWTLDRMQGDARQVLLFLHASGRAMVWQAEGGKYRHSHGFCRGCSGALAKYEELCRSL